MRFHVEQWAPDYAAPFDGDNAPEAPAAVVEEGIEVPLDRWRPVPPDAAEAAHEVLFVDGVQRIDAFVWIDTPAGARPAICAAYAAGAVRCDGKATIGEPIVRRGLFSPAATEPIRTPRCVYEPRVCAGDSVEQLRHGVQEAMAEIECLAASRAGSADLVVLDGAIRASQMLDGAIGYIKSHHVRYLSDEAQPVVGALKPGERTPIFVMKTSWSRYSWYLRLPMGAGHDWSGIVRCEAPVRLGVDAAVALATRAAATLPRYASSPQKDPRAPQNLYPIAGLERELRRRLGDPAYCYRELRAAAGRDRPASGALAAGAGRGRDGSASE